MSLINRRTSILTLALSFLLALGLVQSPAEVFANDAPSASHLSLEEAIAIALSESPQVRTARLELEDARLALGQNRSTSLIRPDPIASFQAESNLELAMRNLTLVQNAVRLDVAESFLSVLRLQNLMDVVRESLALADRQRSIAQSRFEVGAAAEVEITRAANQVNMTQINLLQMEGNRELALLSFRMGLGLPLSADVAPLDQSVEPQQLAVDLEADLEFALRNRLEILRAQNGVEMARRQVQLSDNDYTPAIALERAKVGLQQAEEGLRQARTGIEIEIRQIHNALKDSERRLQVLLDVIEESRTTLQITEEMYTAGVSTDIEVLGAQASLSEAQTNYVDTLFDLLTAQVRYVHATARALADESGGAQ